MASGQNLRGSRAMSERWIFLADGCPGGPSASSGSECSECSVGREGAETGSGSSGSSGISLSATTEVLSEAFSSGLPSSAARISGGAQVSSGWRILSEGSADSSSDQGGVMRGSSSRAEAVSASAGLFSAVSERTRASEAIFSLPISTSKKNADAIQNRADCPPGRRRKNPSICGRGRPAGKRDSAIGSRAETFFLKQFRTAICSAIRSASSR